MENCRFNRCRVTLLPVLSLVSLVACARPDTVVVEQPVGPSSKSAVSADQGWLVVYTDTDGIPDPAVQVQFSGPARLPYTILDSAGQVVQTVVARDETPEAVALSTGNYLVRGSSLQGGTIEVKVRIVGGRTTNVVLDGSWAPEKSTAEWPAVLSPDGSFVGWRAASL